MNVGKRRNQKKVWNGKIWEINVKEFLNLKEGEE
jgi:hypothetical protein